MAPIEVRVVPCFFFCVCFVFPKRNWSRSAWRKLIWPGDPKLGYVQMLGTEPRPHWWQASTLPLNHLESWLYMYCDNPVRYFFIQNLNLSNGNQMLLRQGLKPGNFCLEVLQTHWTIESTMLPWPLTLRHGLLHAKHNLILVKVCVKLFWNFFKLDNTTGVTLNSEANSRWHQCQEKGSQSVYYAIFRNSRGHFTERSTSTKSGNSTESVSGICKNMIVNKIWTPLPLLHSKGKNNLFWRRYICQVY